MTSSGIGASVKRREDVRLVTGQGRYAEDYDAPGQAYAAFVRSPHAHADVVAIDGTPALAVAGVLGVFTGRDLADGGVGAIPTLIAERGGGIRSRDGSAFAEPPWYALATDRDRWGRPALSRSSRPMPTVTAPRRSGGRSRTPAPTSWHAPTSRRARRYGRRACAPRS